MGRRKKEEAPEEVVVENISVEPMEEVMGDRYATYAKYVIQDRAIPDVRDGLKPVQRRMSGSLTASPQPAPPSTIAPSIDIADNLRNLRIFFSFQ